MAAETHSLEDVLWGISSDGKTISLLMSGFTLISLLVCYSLVRAKQHKYAHRFMSIPIFLTTIPGVFFCLVLGYLVFFVSKNLLTVPLFYFFPPLWMAVSLYLFSRMVNFDRIPGFRRLSGLVLFSALTFAAILILFRFRVLAIVWFNPIWAIAIVILFYLIYKSSLDRILKNKS